MNPRSSFSRQSFVTVLLVSFLAGALFSIAGCGTKKKVADTEETEEKLTVAVSNYPLRFFVEQIAGDNVDVLFPVEADIDPAFWKPSSEAVKQLQEAELVFLNGAGYESWIGAVTLSDAKTVETCDNSTAELIEVDAEVAHQHGPDGEHSHKGTAFTTWLDPDLAIIQSSAIHKRLVKQIPYHQATFDDNFRELKTNLRDLRNEMVRVGETLRGHHLVGSHPVYQYLQRVMQLDMHSVHFEPDQDPTAEQWAQFDEMLAKHPTKIMLWEAAPTQSTADELKKRGIKVVVFSQMGNQPADGDLLSELQNSLLSLEAAGVAVGKPAVDVGDLEIEGEADLESLEKVPAKMPNSDDGDLLVPDASEEIDQR